MVKLLKYFFISLFFFIILNQNINSKENKILFKINNEIITSLDIFNELRYLEIINEQFKNTKKKQAFEIAKRSLIREKIKEIELKKVVEEIKLNDQFLNNILGNYFKQIKIKSISDFEKYFTSIDIDPNIIKKKITIEILWNELIFNKYNQNVKIDKQDIINDLKKNDKQKEFLLFEILFNVGENENFDQKYDQIKNKIQKTNFSEAALIYSVSDTATKGGELGWVKELSMSAKVRDSLKNTNARDYSNPMVIPGGFLILKIGDVREIDNNFNLNEEVKKVIKEKTNKQLNQFSNIFFNKIKKNIVINEL